MEKPTLSTLELIKKSLVEKGPLKVDVYQKTEVAFNQLKIVLKNLEVELLQAMNAVDKRVVVKYVERGPFELEFRISDDILIFSMHTDIFTFQEGNQIWKNSYLTDERSRGYCGIISVYNFLTDSLKFNRVNDLGVLIARLFINNENHYFVEGKKQLGFLFNDFDKDELSNEKLREIAESTILFSLNFDILTPPFDQVRMISVKELIEKNLAGVISTGKRLGFKLQSDGDIIG
ncbi:MAG: hypothetical protein M3Q95_07445 [Bacteroidota bacterium]|nr:hypothetical protein [Bacteroidota bacterium]